MARVQGYPDPVHASYEDTTRMYYQSVDFLLEKIYREPERFLVMVASHNEDTVQHVLNKMTQKGLTAQPGSLFFGQSYGMCDYLSSNLGQSGYLAYKSIPYGSVESCLPYLHRRAMENSSALGAVQRERTLLWKAFRGRFSRGNKTNKTVG